MTVKSFLFCLILGACTQNADASGKIWLEPTWYTASAKVRASAGLSVIEQLDEQVSVDVYAGLGEVSSLLEGDENWFVGKVAFPIKHESFSIAPGVRAAYLLPSGEVRPSIFVRATYNLW